MANLLRQIYVTNTSLFLPSLEALHKLCEDGRRRPTFAETRHAFKTACQGVERLVVVIDALDECEHAVRRRLLAAIDPFTNHNIRLFVTGRPYIKIGKCLDRPDMRLFEINMQIPLSDLKLFIEDRITDSEDLTTVIEQNNIKVDRIASRIQDKTPLRQASFSG